MSDTVTIVPKCEAIGCDKPLGYFDIKNHSRFCRSCKANSYNVIRWKCRTCSNIISASEFRETRKYCKDCSGFFPQF